MKRILLLTATNLAVVLLLSATLLVVERVSGIRLGDTGFASLLAVSAVFGFGGALVSLALSKWLAKRTMGVRTFAASQNATEARLLATVRALSQRAGIGMPEVGIFESEDMNAFATGARRDAALVAVSTGLLRGMAPAEVEAVLAHEISHISNGDMVTLTLLQGSLNAFVMFLARFIGSLVDRTVFQDDRDAGGIGYILVTMSAQIVLGLFASMIVCSFSRDRESRADRGGAALAGAASMIGALEALRRSHGEALPPQIQAFAINGGAPGGFMRLFMSHPPLDERIAALRTISQKSNSSFQEPP
jgi:heat shock protein HtpX